MRYTYSTHKTYADAADAIETYFAMAEIFDCDDPDIERLANGRYAVTLRDNLYCY